MPFSDLLIVIEWWGTLFLFGAAAWPLTRKLGLSYFFSKAVGMAAVSWIVFVLGTLHIVPFSIVSILLALGITLLLGYTSNFQFSIFNFQSIFKFISNFKFQIKNSRKKFLKQIPITLLEELFFLIALLFWSWVKAHEPSIRGLEKFMDYGFMQSILNSKFFPPPDMWYAGETINYYYFGHLVTAVLTKLSGLDLGYTFNLMLATIFAFSVTMSFSIGKQLVRGFGVVREIWGGILTAFLVTLAGNMQTIYAFTNGYSGDNVAPFWNLGWTWQGWKIYWYANATRFIPFSIHEFPSYSFVVSDVHGHVLSIPFVLLAIGLLLQKKISSVFYGFLVGVLLMTNALDGPIYLGLFVILGWRNWKNMAIAFSAAALSSLPFLISFNSFVHGIAVNCPPIFLENTKFGPLLFETVDKCQRSPLWMMALLWGFFIYCGAWLFFGQNKKKEHQNNISGRTLKVFFLFSLALIIFPEFFYFKDIYPAHFRSNTMFKLGYQAFILFSIVSAYAITRVRNKLFFVFLIPQLFLVSIYPYFSVRSYFNGLKNYEGIYGLGWLEREYPDDYAAIQWLKTQVGSPTTPNARGAIRTGLPVLIEADGDSYTDYNRFSAFTGMPTVIGWAVHEWLWRGSYDVVSPRREEVRILYESKDDRETLEIIEKYGVRYIIIGSLERQKYQNMSEEKFLRLGRLVFSQGQTKIYLLTTKARNGLIRSSLENPL